MSSSTSPATVLITGSNGYIGTHIASLFLEEGYNVRAVVRSEKAKSKILEIWQAQVQTQRLSVCLVPDLADPEGYCFFLEGVTFVVHAASPLNFNLENFEDEVLQPAIRGAVSILEAIQKYGAQVQRLVSVSSIAAVVDLSKDLRPGYVYSEKDWNPVSHAEAVASDNSIVAYCASKTFAEKAMWDWMAEREGNISFTLSVVNPPVVFGPFYGPADRSSISESIYAVWAPFDSKEVPKTDFAAYIDVRDLAKAVVRISGLPKAAGHRFLLGGRFDWQTAVDIIRERFPAERHRLPQGRVGFGKTEDVYRTDCRKVENMLNMELISLETSLEDLVIQLLEAERLTSEAVVENRKPYYAFNKGSKAINRELLST